MRGLQVTAFVLLALVMGTQSLRHVFVKWIEPHDSVLDEFRPPVEKDIAESDDLDELKAAYAKAHSEVQAFEKKSSLEDIRLARQTERDVYENERKLREAITTVEEQDRSRFRLWFYWCAAVVSIALGLLAYARLNRWLGMVGLLAGFTEMAVWTSPLWRSWGPEKSFEHLLTLKLVLSLVSLALLIGLWIWSERRTRGLPAPGA